jgi:hypothetical protein
VNVNGNGRISWAGGCDPTTAYQSTALHARASGLSLAMSDGELSDNDALTLHTNAVVAEEMLVRRPRESRLLYCTRLARRWLSVIPSLLLPHLVARGINWAILFLLTILLSMSILLL